MADIEKDAGPYVTDLDDAENGDRQRTRYAAWILRNKHAQFMTVHLASLDHLEHAHGPFSPEANATLEQIDAEVGELEAAAPNAIVCVLSDHGFTRTDHSFNIVSVFVEEGLVTMTNKKVTSWTAFPDLEGGSAAIIVKDEASRAKVAKLLSSAWPPIRKMASRRFWTRARLPAFGGRPDAAFWVDMQSNFSVVAVDRPDRVGGTHGYAPSNPQLLASFFIAGPKIKSGVNLGEIDMRSIAGTLARAMGFSFLPFRPIFPLCLCFDIGPMPRIVVIGSANIDLTTFTDQFPRPGETIFGRDFSLGFGGKGANQAVAARNCGANVAMVARVGDDMFGEATIQNFNRLGIDTSRVLMTPGVSTGVAPIFVDSAGQNRILVVKGANDRLSPEDVYAAEDLILSADMVVFQLEIPLLTTIVALQFAKKHGIRTIFKPRSRADPRP